MNRLVEPEWLDALPATDPQAAGSRSDLRRLNYWMGNASIMARELKAYSTPPKPVKIMELGAGDGNFFLQVARHLGPGWQRSRATLLDRHDLVSAETARQFRQLGWEVQAATANVFDWCKVNGHAEPAVVLTNLFLHHFETEPLTQLLRVIARTSTFLVAVEPRRSRLALLFSKLVGLIGCNAVTRHDAPASVRAGFSGNELTRLWGNTGKWLIQERRAGLFSHLFVVQKLL